MNAQSMIAPDGIMPEPAPVVQVGRLVVQETEMSVQVKDVAVALKSIEEAAVLMGGYLVNKNLNQPEGAATGSIIIRIPEEKREATLIEIRKAGVKVISENVSGYDVTDQYVDIGERIAQLERTKAKIEEIMSKATRVADLIDIQNQLNYIQQQIDSYRGQQKYLEQTAKLTRITVWLATDELALPYTPDESWRPEVIFKNAVRTLIGMLRSVGSVLIWAAVFAPLVAVVVLVVWLVNRWLKRLVK